MGESKWSLKNELHLLNSIYQLLRCPSLTISTVDRGHVYTRKYVVYNYRPAIVSTLIAGPYAAYKKMMICTHNNDY